MNPPRQPGQGNSGCGTLEAHGAFGALLFHVAIARHWGRCCGAAQAVSATVLGFLGFCGPWRKLSHTGSSVAALSHPCPGVPVLQGGSREQPSAQPRLLHHQLPLQLFLSCSTKLSSFLWYKKTHLTFPAVISYTGKTPLRTKIMSQATTRV